MRFIALGVIGLAVLLGVQTASLAFAQENGGEGVEVQQPAPADVNIQPVAIDPALQALIDSVQQDLALQLGLVPTDVEVLEARSVVWPDGSLGCPMPDMAYTQAQVEGALVRLRVGDGVYEYHTGGGRIPFLCATPPPAA